MLRRQKGVTNLTTASASYTLVGRSVGGGEGDVPSSSDGLPNVGKGVADILVVFHQSQVGVFLLVFYEGKSRSPWPTHFKITQKYFYVTYT